MKIELDIKDLTETINALNNAINTYNDLKASIAFDMEVPIKYQKLIGTNTDCPEEIVDRRLKLLHDIYNQLLEKENNN